MNNLNYNIMLRNLLEKIYWSGGMMSDIQTVYRINGMYNVELIGME